MTAPRIILLGLLGTGLITVSACAPKAGPAPSLMPELTGSCNADAVAGLIGQPASSEIGQEALRLSTSRSLRWLQPNTAVTMDYQGARLNIKLDDRNIITDFSCG